MFNKKNVIFPVLIIVLGAACTLKTQPLATAASREEKPAAAIASTAADPGTLTVLAAASLTEAFSELGSLFEADNPGVNVSFNFAGSQTLAEQLAQGAQADVFASASKKYMTAAIDAERVLADAPQVFVTNRLAVIFPIENPAGITALKDLAKPGLKLVLADASVPVGQYTIGFLDNASADAAFVPDFKDKVLANVVSYEENVKGVVTKVMLGEADAGVVYVSDITKTAASKTGKLEIPDALNTIAAYPIAAIADSQSPDLAAIFVDLVMSEQGQSVLASYGFIPAVQ